MAHDEIVAHDHNALVVESDSSATNPAPRPGSTRSASLSARARADPGDRRRFEVVLRGYERSAVDERLARVADEAGALRRELAESDRRRTLAEQHASATEGENRTLRSEQRGSRTPEDSFGYRAEKLLRLAEQEAADVRTTAAREAAALLEQTRAEAEQHRHEVEQSLITRSSLLDQQAAQRTAGLADREQQITAQAAAAKAEFEGMHESASRAAERRRQQAEADAEAVRARAVHDARRLREQAEQEVARLGALQESARAEIARLAELLSDGLRASASDDRATEPRTHRIPVAEPRPTGGPAGDPGPGTNRGPVRSAVPQPRAGDDNEAAGRAAAASAAGR